MSSQAGYYASGIPGALLAPLGLISPSIIVITIVAKMLNAFKENKIVEAVFNGLRPAATGLITAAGFGVWKLSLYNPGFTTWYEFLRWKECILLIIMYFGIIRFKGHPIIYVIIAGAVGIIFKL